MTARGFAAALLAVAVVGGAGGAAAAALTRPDPVAGVLTPIPATDPSIPIDPLPPIAPDADLPPMPTTLPTVPANLGGPTFGFEFPVPAGWERRQTDVNQARWYLPGDPPNAYQARVELVTTGGAPPARLVATRPQDLADASAVSHLQVLASGPNTLTVKFLYRNSSGSYHWVCTAYAWVSRPGAPAGAVADVEIALTGRVEDLPGLQALRGQMMSNVRKAG